MAFWAMPQRPEATDRDATFYWQDPESMSGDGQNDFFGQFVDFGGEDLASNTDDPSAFSSNVRDEFQQESPFLRDPFLTDQTTESTASSAISTADDFDFLSNSSHPLATASSSLGSHEVDPQSLSVYDQEVEVPPSERYPRAFADDQHNERGGGSLSDMDLPHVGGISLYSPTKNEFSDDRSSSPTPPNTARRPAKLLNAISTGIRRATALPTTLRKTRKQAPASPELPSPLTVTKQRPAKGRSTTATLPSAHESKPANFIHGPCDDPFSEAAPLQLHPAPPPGPVRYFSHDGFTTPLDSPAIRSEPGSAYPGDSFAHGSWSQPIGPGSGAAGAQWSYGPEHVPHASQHQGQEGWWDGNLAGQHVGDGEYYNYAIPPQRNPDMPYDYTALPDTGAAGLMIQMPQARPPQPTVIGGQTYLPPPPPIPPSQPASEARSRKAPRARSSGARHLSCSPVRKQRAPSASPIPNTPSQGRTRHSSGGSISSIRSNASASGTTRLPGSMPGTPCSVRKRRSREPSGSAAAAAASSFAGGGAGLGISLGSGGGGGGGGFVNFTPNDGGVLMTGVAPSGSSKTKARREKEALERRRKMSEAAMKAVAAAGGDVEKLLEHGFAY